MKNYTKNIKKYMKTQKKFATYFKNNFLKSSNKLILDLDATIRYAAFSKVGSLKELDKIIETYFHRNFHISENYIKDYEIVKQNSDEVCAILVAIRSENIFPLLKNKPKQLKLKQIEVAKSIAKKESTKCLLFTENYYFYIVNNAIEDVIDARIFGPNWIMQEYDVSKVYFLPRK